MKHLLVFEPHIDDMELGLSIYLEQIKEEFTLTIVTMCGLGNTRKGRNQDRINKRLDNIDTIKKKCKEVQWIRIEKIDFGDTTNGIGWAQEIREAFTPKHKYTMFYCTKDLHPDHNRMYDAIRILTRPNKAYIQTEIEIEYIIENSRDQTELFVSNYEVSIGGTEEDVTKTFSYNSCLFPGEDLIVDDQKDLRDNKITDYFKIVKFRGLL